MSHILGSLCGKMRRKRPIISIIWTAHQGSFWGLIVFCLNKSVNEHQSRDAGSSRCISADLRVPADLGQTLGKAKTNLSVSTGLGVLIRGPDSLSAAPSQASALPDWYKSRFSKPQRFAERVSSSPWWWFACTFKRPLITQLERENVGPLWTRRSGWVLW